MNATRIQWTEKTWNPVTGCTKRSAGCEHCYAEVMAKRLKAMGVPKYKDGFELRTHPEALDEVLGHKKGSMVFVCSMSDLFHEKVPFDFVDRIMDAIEKTPENTYQILTKRPERMAAYFNGFKKPPANAWLGTTVENRKEAYFRIEALKSIRGASLKFLSCEPLLEDLGNIDLEGVGWVIVGGESGPKGRRMDKGWVLSIKAQCEKKRVPFFFKQWGTYGEDGVKRTKGENGCLLDGKIRQETPEKARRPEDESQQTDRKIKALHT